MYEPAKYRTKLTIVFTVAWQLKHQPAEKCGGQLNSLHGIFSLLHTFDKTIKLFPIYFDVWILSATEDSINYFQLVSQRNQLKNPILSFGDGSL